MTENWFHEQQPKRWGWGRAKPLETLSAGPKACSEKGWVTNTDMYSSRLEINPNCLPLVRYLLPLTAGPGVEYVSTPTAICFADIGFIF